MLVRLAVVGIALAAPACNQTRDLPGPGAPPPKPETVSGYNDELPNDDAELNSAVFNYSKHNGEEDDSERPLADTVVHVTT